MTLKARNRQQGQSLVEMASALPIFLILVIGFVGLAIQVVARMQIDTALHLATVSALEASLGDGTNAQAYANYTFDQTVKADGGWLKAPLTGFSCSGDYLSGTHENVNSQSPVVLTCKSTAVTIDYGNLGVLAMIWPKTVTIATITTPISATVYPGSYRSCVNEVSCS